MPYYSAIRDIVLGDYFTVSRKIIRPSDLNELSDGWFSIMTADPAGNPTPFVQKHVTTAVSLEDGYLINASGVDESSLLFIIGSGLTQDMEAGETYLYDIQVKDIDSKLYTVERGNFIPEAQVTFIY